MIVLEIISEAKERTRIKARRNGKRIIIIGCTLSALLTVAFYSLGIHQPDPLYQKVPLIYQMPLVAFQSFVAVFWTSMTILFLKSLGESTTSTVKNSLEQRYEKKIEKEATAIRNQFNQYGQKDYSLQIDEAKQGLEHKISEWTKFTSELAKRFSNKSFVTDVRVSRLEREVRELQEKLKNTVPLSEYDIILKELMKVKEELRKLKGD